MSDINLGICPITVLAVGAISAYHFVGVDKAAAGAGANAIGVAATDGTDEHITIDTAGIVPVIAGAAIAEGDAVQVDANSQAITKVAGVTVGRAMEAATAAGQRIQIQLIPN